MSSWWKLVNEKIPRSIVSAAVVALILLMMVAGLKNYRDLTAAHAREEVLQQRIEERRAGVAELERHLERLRQDPVLLERLAREELGMAYGDELVLVLPAGETPGRRTAAIAARE